MSLSGYQIISAPPRKDQMISFSNYVERANKTVFLNSVGAAEPVEGARVTHHVRSRQRVNGIFPCWERELLAYDMIFARLREVNYLWCQYLPVNALYFHTSSS